MVGVTAGNDVLLFRPVQDIVVEHHKTQRRIHRGRSAGCVKHVVKVSGRDCGKAVSQTGCRFGGMAPWAGIRKLRGLLMNSIDNLLLAVAGIDAPHTPGAIQQAVSFCIKNIRPFTDTQNRTACVGLVKRLPRVNHVSIHAPDHREVDGAAR